MALQVSKSRHVATRLRTNNGGIVNSHEYIQSVIDRLRIVKESMTYSEMESSCKIHATLLCRYVTGSTRPSKEQAELLEKSLLERTGFKEKLGERIEKGDGGYLDLHQLTSDPNALKWISADLASQFRDLRCERVLTAAASGITLATAVAMQFGVPIVYADTSKSAGAGPYFEADLHSQNPSEISTLYLPSNLARKGDSIIIVDDIATSGRTLSGLIELAQKAQCKISAIFVLISRGRAWRERIGASQLEKNSVRISVYLEIGKRGL